MYKFFTIRIHYEDSIFKYATMGELTSNNLESLQDDVVDKFISQPNEVVFIYSISSKGLVLEAEYDFRERDEYGLWIQRTE